MRIIPEEEENSHFLQEHQTVETSLLNISLMSAHRTPKLGIRTKIMSIIEAGSHNSCEKNETRVVKANSYARVKHFSFEQTKLRTYCVCKQRKDAFDQ